MGGDMSKAQPALTLHRSLRRKEILQMHFSKVVVASLGFNSLVL